MQNGHVARAMATTTSAGAAAARQVELGEGSHCLRVGNVPFEVGRAGHGAVVRISTCSDIISPYLDALPPPTTTSADETSDASTITTSLLLPF